MITADHQNKPDIANTKAQELYDRQEADVILDVPTSSAALAVASAGQDQEEAASSTSAPATTALTGAQCNKYTFHYAYDTYMLANGTGDGDHRGRRQDLAPGLPRLRVRPGHAEVVHRRRSRAPAARSGNDPDAVPERQLRHLPAPRRAASDPDVIGTMQAGGDLINVVKQYNESGLREQGISSRSG